MSTSSSQWLSLVGVIWIQSINGTNSDFPAYSTQLKELLSISQLQLNNLAFASDAGKLLGWISGFVANHLPLWLVLLIGSFLGLIGYGLQYLLFTNQISSLSYWHIFFLIVLAGNSICWMNTVCYTVTNHNFPSDRQVAVGITTSYVGLSAKIYTDIVSSLFPSLPIKRAKAYLLLNSVLPLIVCTIVSPIVKELTVEKTNTAGTGFMFMFLITIVTGVYAVISSLGLISGRSVPAIITGAFLFAPVMIPAGNRIWEEVLKKRGNGVNRVHVIEDEENSGVKEGAVEAISSEKEEGIKEEIGVKLMVQRIDFWLYFFVYLFGATLGLVFLNNLGQIAESRGCSKTTSLVSLSSSFGFFGRLIPSLLDYFIPRLKYTVPRPASIAALMAAMALSFFLLLNKSHLSLYISTAIIGVCTGAVTSISVSTTTELFGTKNFGVNHNVVVVNIPIGSFLFGYFAALVYHKEGNGEDGKCIGMGCYRMTFVIWGCFCFLGTFLALVLFARTRKFYSQIR